MALQNTQTGPLKGIRILDLTRLLPGPLGSQMLGDLGAEVIKIEDPKAPDYSRFFPPHKGSLSLMYLAVNRSKKCISIDLKSEEGRAIFYDLAASADIVLDSFRPGVLQKMGLDYETVKKINPKIIYVSITGYGNNGPYMNKAGHDLNYIGYAGLLGLTGTKAAPVMPAPQIADIAGGSYPMVIACLSAIIARNTTGVGQFVDVAMTDASIPLISFLLFEQMNTGKTFYREEPMLSGGMANYNIYECKDGGFMAMGALEPKFWQEFCIAIGKLEWIPRMLPDPKMVAELKQDLEALFLTKTKEEWADFSSNYDFCLTPILDLDEVSQDKHLIARNMFLEMEHADYGKIKTINQPLQFGGTPTAPNIPPALMGEHTNEILSSIGYSEEKLEGLKKKGII